MARQKKVQKEAQKAVEKVTPPVSAPVEVVKSPEAVPAKKTVVAKPKKVVEPLLVPEAPETPQKSSPVPSATVGKKKGRKQLEQLTQKEQPVAVKVVKAKPLTVTAKVCASEDDESITLQKLKTKRTVAVKKVEEEKTAVQKAPAESKKAAKPTGRTLAKKAPPPEMEVSPRVVQNVKTKVQKAAEAIEKTTEEASKAALSELTNASKKAKTKKVNERKLETGEASEQAFTIATVAVAKKVAESVVEKVMLKMRHQATEVSEQEEVVKKPAAKKMKKPAVAPKPTNVFEMCTMGTQCPSPLTKKKMTPKVVEKEPSTSPTLKTVPKKKVVKKVCVSPAEAGPQDAIENKEVTGARTFEVCTMETQCPPPLTKRKVTPKVVEKEPPTSPTLNTVPKKKVVKKGCVSPAEAGPQDAIEKKEVTGARTSPVPKKRKIVTEKKVSGRPVTEPANGPAHEPEKKTVVALKRTKKAAAAKAIEASSMDDDESSLSSIYEFTVQDAEGQDVSLSKYKGHAVLVVNVTGECGSADYSHKMNYTQMKALLDTYHSQGLRIAAFPCNLVNQKPSAPGVKAVDIKNDVLETFEFEPDFYGRVDVNGFDAEPLYKFMRAEQGSYGVIKRNFVKFLVDKNGYVVKRYLGGVQPKNMAEDIEILLAGGKL